MQKVTKILIVGGGFGGINAGLELKKLLKHRVVRDDAKNSPYPPARTPLAGGPFSQKKGDEVEITLVSRDNYFLFTPLLHEVATGSVNQSNVVEPLRKILGPQIKFRLAEAESIDTTQNILKTSRGNFEYDFLFMSLGSKNFYGNLKPEHTFSLKTLNDARALKNHLISCFGRAAAMPEKSIERKSELTVVLAGAGPTGVELACEIEEFFFDLLVMFPEISPQEPKIYLIQRSGNILPNFHKKISQKSQKLLKEKKCLRLLLNEEILEHFPQSVKLKSGQILPTKTVISTIGVWPNLPLLENAPKTAKDKLIVNQFLQVKGYENIFAAGDMAEVPCEKHSWPQSAQAAEAAGKHAARNIYRLLKGKPPKPFFYTERGQLVSLGNWNAAAEIFHFTFFGHFAWWVWRTIYLSKIPGLAKKIRVVTDWTIDIFYPRDISRL